MREKKKKKRENVYHWTPRGTERDGTGRLAERNAWHGKEKERLPRLFHAELSSRVRAEGIRAKIMQYCMKYTVCVAGS